MKLNVFVIMLVSCSLNSAQINYRELGNKAFEMQDYESAIVHYSQGIFFSDTDKLLFRNRALAQFNLSHFTKSEDDLQKALALDYNDAKTNFWLGKINWQNNRLSRAYYFFTQAKKYSNDKKIKTQCDQFIDKISIKINAVINDNTEQELDWLKDSTDIASLMRNLLICQDLLDYHEYLEQYWQEAECLPINLQENPQEIAHFVGQGTAIATVIVQTLPIHFSKSFKHVFVYDISQQQIDFQSQLVKAINENQLSDFIVQAKKPLKQFIQKKTTNILNKKISKQIDEQFDLSYTGLKTFKSVKNVVSSKNSIFDAVSNELATEKSDTVFLSTIPYLKKEKWLDYYCHLRTWVIQGKTIIFSLCNPKDMSSMMKEYTDSFKDIANFYAKISEKTPYIYYIKIVPFKT